MFARAVERRPCGWGHNIETLTFQSCASISDCSGMRDTHTILKRGPFSGAGQPFGPVAIQTCRSVSLAARLIWEPNCFQHAFLATAIAGFALAAWAWLHHMAGAFQASSPNLSRLDRRRSGPFFGLMDRRADVMGAWMPESRPVHGRQHALTIAMASCDPKGINSRIALLPALVQRPRFRTHCRTGWPINLPVI